MSGQQFENVVAEKVTYKDSAIIFSNTKVMMDEGYSDEEYKISSIVAIYNIANIIKVTKEH